MARVNRDKVAQCRHPEVANQVSEPGVIGLLCGACGHRLSLGWAGEPAVDVRAAALIAESEALDGRIGGMTWGEVAGQAGAEAHYGSPQWQVGWLFDAYLRHDELAGEAEHRVRFADPVAIFGLGGDGRAKMFDVAAGKETDLADLFDREVTAANAAQAVGPDELVTAIVNSPPPSGFQPINAEFRVYCGRCGADPCACDEDVRRDAMQAGCRTVVATLTDDEVIAEIASAPAREPKAPLWLERVVTEWPAREPIQIEINATIGGDPLVTEVIASDHVACSASGCLATIDTLLLVEDTEWGSVDGAWFCPAHVLSKPREPVDNA